MINNKKYLKDMNIVNRYILVLSICIVFHPLSICNSEDSSEVWFGPAIGSPDMLQLFTDSTQWDSARSQVDVLQFLTHHVNSWPCFGGLCDSNILENFAEVDAFLKLQDWGIDVAIEGAGILPQTPYGIPVDCEIEKQTAVQNAFNWTADAINNIYANGGSVRYIAIDEPIRRWYSPIYPPTEGPECKTGDLEEIATMVADFITMMNNAAPFIDIGQIILYPELDVDGIKEYMIDLESMGINLAFVHLDVHGLRIIDYAGTFYGRITLEQAKEDMLELKNFFQDRNIPFAPILIDLSFTYQLYEYGDYTDEVYYAGAIDWINEVNDAIGLPNHLVFESWARPQYSDTDIVRVNIPINLPENDPAVFSHTRLINEALTIFGYSETACCLDMRGNIDSDSLDQIEITDLVYLIEFSFGNGPQPICFNEADVDGSLTLDIADIVYLVNYMFSGGPAPHGC